MSEKLRIIKKEPWYKDGLKFKCTGCGECCTGAPGAVWVTDEEIDIIANHLKLSRQNFLKDYAKTIAGRISLRDRPITYDCIFLENKKCSIYQYRPQQCRTYPWWTKILESEKDWNDAAKWCEGINHQDAPTISYEEITAQVFDNSQEN